MKAYKKEPWRIILAVVCIIFIIFMWIKKDIAAIYSTMPKEQVLPLIFTSVAVTLIKVVALAVVIFIIKWISAKFKINK